MHCPHCNQPLWREFIANLYNPRSGNQQTCCKSCCHKATYVLPDYLSEETHVWFGAGVIALTLLAATAVDTTTAIQLNVGLSIFLAWAGLIALLMWTRTSVQA